MYQALLKNLIYPCIEIRYPQEERSIAHLKFLEKTQWWRLKDLLKFQEKKLHAILEHAYRNVPYYHKMFNQLKIKPQDIKTVSDLQKLPILKKEIVRNYKDDLIAKNYSKGELIFSATGGSTGEPMSFFVDRKWSAWNIAAAYREWNWAGYCMGQKIVYLWGAHQDLSKQQELKIKLSNLINRRIMLDAYKMNRKMLDNSVKVLKKFKPKFINAYPSAIYLMSQYIEKKGLGDIRPRAIFTSCETLLDNQRRTIENIFDCDVFDYVLVSNHYGETGEPGWIREDVDKNGLINILDIYYFLVQEL